MQRHKNGILLNGFVDPLTTSELINDAGFLTAADIDATVFNEVPVEGGTITLPNVDDEIVLNMAPATDLTNLTINLPGNNPGKVGQRIFIASTRQISNVTVSGALPVNNNVVMFSPGDNVVFFRNQPSSWSRLIG